MKAKLLLIASLLNGAIFACNDHLYRLALNQRSYYNPAALCPYCKGSLFFATGLNFIPGDNSGMGMYYSVGNDGPGIANNPWDLTYSAVRSNTNHIDAYSFRYALAIQTDKWKIAAGARESYYSIKEKVLMFDQSNQTYSAKMFDTDLGIMFTNQKGFYVGMSVLHVNSPSKNTTSENGNMSYMINMNPNFNVMGGYVQKINKKWDVLPDVNLMHSKTESVAQTGAMIRYKHHFTAGGGVTFSNDEPVDFEIRGGYMSSTFKWLACVAPTAQGWTVETGIVLRFQSGPCDGTARGGRGGTCNANGGPKPHVKAEHVRDNDDFVRHR